MPGASLWLVPPADSKVGHILSTLITETVPAQFPEVQAPPKFPAHLTLTSDIPETIAENEPQKWLDALSLVVADPPSVSFDSLDVGQPFFRKLTLNVSKAPLLSLTTQVRAAAVEDGKHDVAKRWTADTYAPHVSLLYADIEIDESRRRSVLRDIENAGIRLMNEGFCSASTGKGHSGWEGGRIVLVPTWKELKDWTIVAERSL